MSRQLTDARRERVSGSHTLLASAVFILVYLLTARAGLHLAYYQQNATLIWAPSGLAVAALWRYGWRFAPAVFIAALATNFSIGSHIGVSALIAIGNTAEALIALALASRADLRAGVWRVRDVPAFIALIVIGSTFVSAANGVLTLVAFGGLPIAKAWTTGLIWWLGDAGGVLVVTPVFTAFARPAPRLGETRVREIVLVGVFAVLSTALVFGGLLPGSWAKLPVALLPYPALVWASTRFGMRGSASSVAGVTLAAVAGTVLGTGPFRYGNVHVDVAMLWLFLSTMAMSSMLLAASIEERTREVVARREGDQWLALALDAGEAETFERDMIDGVERRYDPSTHGMVETEWETAARWTDRMHADDRAAVRDAIDACRSPGHDAWECEYRVGSRWMLERARVIEREASGAPHRAVGLRRDVTARREAEEQRRALERDLERTQALGELGMLAGGVAHDFNNILTIIRANIDHARETTNTASRDESLEAIDEATSRAADLTEQLLAYAGRKPLRRRDVNLGQLCAETVRMLNAGLPEGVTLELAVVPETPLVEADPAQLRQVLMNLLWNAIEAMNGRTGRITVRLHKSTDDTVLLEVQDEGVGMDEATRSRVFEPFFSTKPRGRGLGMAAVLGIVRSHGGRIEATSTAGKGSTFSVYLPATDRLPRASAPSPAHHVRSSIPPSTGSARRQRVLVVDDEPAIRSVARMLLEDADYTAVEAGSGDEAVRCFDESGPFDAVLLDMTMPDTSGVELMARLKLKAPDLRVVLMSGYSEDLVHGRAPAGVPFLAKPFRGAGLLERVRETLADGSHGSDAVT